MKITDIKVATKGLPRSNSVLVEVQTDEGLSGIGATYVAQDINKSDVDDYIDLEENSLRSLLIGLDPTDIDHCWNTMLSKGPGIGVIDTKANLEHDIRVQWVNKEQSPTRAMAAVDIALWDLAGKAKGVPIYELLGGAVQSRVKVYASYTAFDVALYHSKGILRHKSKEEILEELQLDLDLGFKAFKWGWGNYFSKKDRDVLFAIRDAIGPEKLLMLDFGGFPKPGWRLEDAVELTNSLEEHDIYFLEELLPPTDVDGFEALTKQSPVKVATGEHLSTVYDCMSFINRDALHILQADAQNMGLTQLVQVARMADQANIICIPHGPWTAILAASHLNVFATLKNGFMIEYPSRSIHKGGDLESLIWPMFDTLIETPPKFEDGYLLLPDSPGLGLGNIVPEGVDGLKKLQHLMD